MAFEFEHVPPAPVSSLATEHMVRMRDGIRLATDVYLPPGGDGATETVLVRLPYDKCGDYCFMPRLAPLFTAQGYAFVVQDVRAGFSIFGIVFGGGAGAYLAEWIVDGQPSDSMWELELAGVPVRTLRLSYVGELGFELHHPIERSLELYDAVLEAGADLGLVDFGYRALESMRLEQAYRLWGADIDADHSPLEAGLERFVALDKGDFIGRDALLREARDGPARVLACLAVEGAGPHPHGGEAVMAAGAVVGHVSAGGYGHCVGRAIALAYLPRELVGAGAKFEVDLLGEHMIASAVIGAPLLTLRSCGRAPGRPHA